MGRFSLLLSIKPNQEKGKAEDVLLPLISADPALKKIMAVD